MSWLHVCPSVFDFIHMNNVLLVYFSFCKFLTWSFYGWGHRGMEWLKCACLKVRLKTYAWMRNSRTRILKANSFLLASYPRWKHSIPSSFAKLGDKGYEVVLNTKNSVGLGVIRVAMTVEFHKEFHSSPALHSCYYTPSPSRTLIVPPFHRRGG